MDPCGHGEREELAAVLGGVMGHLPCGVQKIDHWYIDHDGACEVAGIIAEAAREAGHDSTHHWSTKEEAGEALASDLRSDDVVLLKASRAMALETLLAVLKE